MITIIICMVIVAVLFIIWWKNNESDLFLLVILTVLGLTLGAIPGMILCVCLPTPTIDKVVTHNLISLKDNNSISGSFFLGSGIINNEMRYSYYYNCGNDNYKLTSVSANNTYVKYTKDKPRIEYHYKEINSKSNWKYFSNLLSDGGYYIIYIPEGSIKYNFVLDAE